jgi:hypothetical protein
MFFLPIMMLECTIKDEGTTNLLKTKPTTTKI